MIKRSIFTVITFFLFLLLTGCSRNNIILPPEAGETAHNLITDRKKIENVLTALGQVNLNWMARPGWVHSERIPADGEIIKFTYQDRWTHYINDLGDCAEEMWLVRKTYTSENEQQRIRLATGAQGELVALRTFSETPDKIPSYADPRVEVQPCRAQDRSPVLFDLQEEIQSIQANITDLRLWEETLVGKDLYVLYIVCKGDDSALGIPNNAQGKMTMIFYEKETGNRVKMILKLLYAGEEWKGETWVDESYEFVENLPREVADEYELAQKELDFYLDILARK
jgi:hypothetical protein